MPLMQTIVALFLLIFVGFVGWRLFLRDEELAEVNRYIKWTAASHVKPEDVFGEVKIRYPKILLLPDKQKDPDWQEEIDRLALVDLHRERIYFDPVKMRAVRRPHSTREKQIIQDALTADVERDLQRPEF